MSESNTDIIDLEKELDKLIAELTENVSAKQKAKIKEVKRKWLKNNKEKRSKELVEAQKRYYEKNRKVLTFRTPSEIASDRQIINAKKLQTRKDSEGQEAIRRSLVGDRPTDDFPIGFFDERIESFFVGTNYPHIYVVRKTKDSIFECNKIERDGTIGSICMGFRNCSYLPNPRQEKICKHIVAVDLKFGNKE
jgi:hypothetical protein